MPALGGPHFVGDIKAESWEAERRDWPRQPIDLVDGVPFLVVDGYFLTGLPEAASHYLDFCVQNCDWGDETFRPKSVREKKLALAKLEASARWKQPLSENAKKALASQIE